MGIFFKAHINFTCLCLNIINIYTAKYTAPNWPSYKYFRISKSSIVGYFPLLLFNDDLTPPKLCIRLIRSIVFKAAELVVDAVFLRYSLIRSCLVGLFYDTCVYECSELVYSGGLTKLYVNFLWIWLYFSLGGMKYSDFDVESWFFLFKI